jgi:uncharacterized phage protein gp47/JayE
MSGVNGVDYGCTPTGFIPKRLADIVADRKAALEAIVDPVSGESLQIDENDGSVISQMMLICAEAEADCWQALAAVAVQFDPLRNTGEGQSGTVQLNGILRRPGYASIVTMVLTGTVGTLIPAGSLIGTSDGKYQFETLADAVIGENIYSVLTNTAVIDAQCTVFGPVDPDSNTVTAVLTPIAGWTGAYNVALVLLGADAETDAQLRQRQQLSTASRSYCQTEAIYDAINDVEGVTYCRVYVNSTMSTDARGIPAKSIACVVVGGTDEDVANAIFSKAPVGIGYYGNLTENSGQGIQITDEQGFDYYVNFFRPIEVDIDVTIHIDSMDSTFPGDYATQIQQAILAFVAGGAGALGIPSHFDRYGFPPGMSIIRTQLYTPINYVPGLSIVSLALAVHGNTPEEQDIAIAWNQYGSFSAANISVTKDN